MTKDQHAARELIALYEGASRVTCEQEGSYLAVETDTGSRWLVDRDGEHIIGPTGRRWDLCKLEAHIADPDSFEPDPGPVLDDYALEAPGPVTDFHSDREAEIRALKQDEIDDRNWQVQQERRFTY